jgi:2-desacetyl-2-hydroxyethyl bacteriochlorophyllide A dehydrogenase
MAVAFSTNKPSLMRAIVYTELDAITLQDLPVPDVGDHDVLVRTRASGICQTDVEVLKGHYGNSTFPLVPGHEYAGEIVAVGSAVTDYAVDDRVVVDPNINCGTCRACKRGLTNLCDTLGAYGVTVNGGFEEFSAVNTSNLVRIDQMPFKLAALAEPMACVLNGVSRVDVSGTAMIFGAGPIGMLMAIALREKGIDEVTLVDIDAGRLELASSFGFATLESAAANTDPYRHHFDLVIDATGVTSVAQGLINNTANGGQVLFFGVCAPDAQVQISPFEVFRRQIRIAGAHSLNRNIPEAIDVIRSVGPDIGRLVSHEVALDDIPGFLDGTNREGTLKVQAVW